MMAAGCSWLGNLQERRFGAVASMGVDATIRRSQH
jgi:hypothetical protein